MAKNDTVNQNPVEHPRDLLAGYALGALDPDDQVQVRTHLADCQVCRVEAASYERVVSRLPFGVAEVEPPQNLKSRIMGRVGNQVRSTEEPVRPRRKPAGGGFLDRFRMTAPVWGVASLVVALVLFAASLVLLRQAQLVSSEATALRVINLEAEFNAPEAAGIVVVSKDGEHGTLVVDHLPALEEGQEYQLWLEYEGERTSGGVFSVGKDGYGALWVKAPLPLAAYQAFGITVEPAGGSPQPTGPRVLRAELE